MFKIIINTFQMDINCILMFMIIIHLFQKDFICILMKYYFSVYNYNSCISNGH